MKDLVFATSNKGKLVELQGLVGAGLTIQSLADSMPEIATTPGTRS